MVRSGIEDSTNAFIHDLGAMDADAAAYSYRYHVSSRLLYRSMISEVVTEYRDQQKSGNSFAFTAALMRSLRGGILKK